MQFRNEDGLTFNCRQLDKCEFDMTTGSMYTLAISLDDELYAVSSNRFESACKRKMHEFVDTYKIPVKFIKVTQTKDGYSFEEQFEYTYEKHLKWKVKNKRLQNEALLKSI